MAEGNKRNRSNHVNGNSPDNGAIGSNRNITGVGGGGPQRGGGASRFMMPVVKPKDFKKTFLRAVIKNR